AETTRSGYSVHRVGALRLPGGPSTLARAPRIRDDRARGLRHAPGLRPSSPGPARDDVAERALDADTASETVPAPEAARAPNRPPSEAEAEAAPAAGCPRGAHRDVRQPAAARRIPPL